jgi:hypothetical protein
MAGEWSKEFCSYATARILLLNAFSACLLTVPLVSLHCTRAYLATALRLHWQCVPATDLESFPPTNTLQAAPIHHDRSLQLVHARSDQQQHKKAWHSWPCSAWHKKETNIQTAFQVSHIFPRINCVKL